jgi:tetratricopeptide (TPR) repeat protein
MRIFSIVLVFCFLCTLSPIQAIEDDLSDERQRMQDFDQMRPQDQSVFRERATDLVKEWFPKYTLGKTYKDRSPVSSLFQGLYSHAAKYSGVSNSHIIPQLEMDLKMATDLDPTLVEVWLARGLIVQLQGRLSDSNHFFRVAQLAAKGSECRPEANAEVRLNLHQALAINYRNLTNWDACRAEIEAGFKVRPKEPFLMVFKGLLLAGEGSYSEAVRLAIQMPGLRFRHQTNLSMGYSARPSDYANRWIRSQALMAVGDYPAARHALGDLEDESFYRLPIGRSFWNDAGLVFELCGDPEAVDNYTRAYSHNILGPLMPITVSALGPVVLDLPHEDTPYWVSEDGYYLGGSPFSYVASQLNSMAKAPDDAFRTAARDRALDMLSNLERRGVPQDLCCAFRARVLMADGETFAAYDDLKLAHEAFGARGVFDQGTSLLLGQLHLLRNEPEAARTVFSEVVDKSPDKGLAWREMGVACSQAGDQEAALEAMNLALELEPLSAPGWFNHGVFLFRQSQYDEALKSLEKAYQLDPENAEIMHMLQRVNRARR